MFLQKIATVQLDCRTIMDADYCADGTRLTSILSDGRITVWNTQAR
jgi:hypothetical protein